MTPRERAAAFFGGMHLGCDDFPEPAGIDQRLDHYCGLILNAAYAEAYKQLRADKSLTDAEKKTIIVAINSECLFKRQLEWGNHGVMKSFRFWNFNEKAEYLRRAKEIADFVRAEVTPHVCFGFGSVLGYVRDKDFIPHDDDMDLVIALPLEADSKFASVKQSLKDKFEAGGFRVFGDENMSHLTIVRGSYAGTDVFIGFVDPDDRVSWFPSRRGTSRFEDVFPARSVNWFGIDCPMPADAEKYVAAVYGEDWRKPIANWNHPWDRTQYKEFL